MEPVRQLKLIDIPAEKITTSYFKEYKWELMIIFQIKGYITILLLRNFVLLTASFISFEKQKTDLKNKY